MTEIKYNKAQINELKANKYVKNVTEKHIVFKTEFKMKALKLSNKHMLSKEIFEKL
jgi:parvulin-like peptidyl-prolyl isomerase